MNAVANKSFRKNIADMSIETVVALSAFSAARAELSSRVLEMIEEDGSATVREIVAALFEGGVSKSQAAVIVDCAIEDEETFELSAGDLIVRG